MTLRWSHATNTRANMMVATTDSNISAIECDILLGVAHEGGTSFYETPILAHPPHRESDISVATLLLLITKKNDEKKELQKHLKLDFKEIDVVEPSLELLELSNLSNPLEKTIILNADILSGPGRRNETPVPANIFLKTCLDYVQSCEEPSMTFSFSLGYKCDWASEEPYSNVDVASMAELVRDYNLMDGRIGTVLALNARLLAVRPDAIDEFLYEFPKSRILAWTGSGEPMIPVGLIEKIRGHFLSRGLGGRIDFDCDVEEDECNSEEETMGENTASRQPSRSIWGSSDPASSIYYLGAGLAVGVALGIAIGRRI